MMSGIEGGDFGGSGDEPTTPPQASPASGGGIGATRGGMTIGEQLLALGAILLVGVDLIGDLIVEEFGVALMPWFLAVLALAAIGVKRMRSGDLPLPYTWVLVTLGYLVAFLTVYYFLFDLRGDFYDGADVFWALVTYAGGILMGVGAYMLSKA